MVNLEITGEAEVAARLDMAIAKMGLGAQEGKKAWAEETIQVMKSLAPVELGELRGSIGLANDVSTDSAKLIDIVVTSPHAIYPEFGTSNMDAQPYFRPAIHQTRASGLAKAAAAIKRIVGF